MANGLSFYTSIGLVDVWLTQPKVEPEAPDEFITVAALTFTRILHCKHLHEFCC